MSRLKTGAIERDIALTRLGLGAGTQIAAHSFFNVFRSAAGREAANRDFYERQARVLADQLGQLKGGVMKAGQMLSLYGQYFLPPEAVAVLSELQDSTQPVDWAVVEPVLERAIGRARMAELDIDPAPIGAASLGQVHCAYRKSDGLKLAVKIQYPGVAAAIDSDVNSLSKVVMFTRIAPKGLNLIPVFSEVREMLHREVDYVAERHFTQDYCRRLGPDLRFVVPRVLERYSGPEVLTTTFEEGVSVRDPSVQALPQARRDRLGRTMVELFLTEFLVWHQVQSDPHFGNYRFRLGMAKDGSEDRIVLLDFGATRTFKPEFVRRYAGIVSGAVARDRGRILDGAAGIGLMHENFPADVLDGFVRMCELIVEPFNDHARDGTPPELLNAKGEYCWGRSDLVVRVGNVAARNALSRYFRIPPREIIFLHRRLAGVFVLCTVLNAEFNARDMLLAALDKAR
ncbi:MAG: AarF/ABC1/UbiB kinase family protein [Nevskiaceae bacterium]|nr:MAG: AarF/ABC1/UbiB kinase family protein [Nevskiaceae bacterium]TBR71933.1 MAG: AarF/ABC1/UbiB kinase family protein [Nevskiaceae bacterium]